MGHFINRAETLNLLETMWKRKNSQFLAVYGRRRVGKTALLSNFAKRKSFCHWIAYRTTSRELLQDFSMQLYTYLNQGEIPEPDFTYGSWKVALETLASFAKAKRLGVIIDEFPYVVEANSSFPSMLQAVWDKKLSKADVFLAISGSRISMMKDEILKEKGPLYGRATGVIHLQPIRISDLNEFFPKYSKVQLIEVYGITGGVPKYFEFMSSQIPVLKNIEEAIKSKSTLLTSEPDFLLHEEFRETRIYLAILRALGRGSLDLRSVSNISGVDAKALSKYLDQLIELKFAERNVPTGEDSSRSRKGRYCICDPFLNFYFRFIAPHLQDIEKDRFNQVIEHIRKEFDAYIGKFVFEKLCQEWLADAADQGKLSFIPTDIGNYWDKDLQLDVLGINHHDQSMIVGEAKWTNKKVGLETFRALERKARKLSNKNGYYFQLAIFSRAGFTAKLVETANKKNVLLVSLSDIIVG